MPSKTRCQIPYKKLQQALTSFLQYSGTPSTWITAEHRRARTMLLISSLLLIESQLICHPQSHNLQFNKYISTTIQILRLMNR